MIKIPKNLDDLKKMVADAADNVNVGDVLNKVKTTINTATDTVKSAAESMSSSKPAGEVKDIFDNLAKNHQAQHDYVKQLQQHINQLHDRINMLEKALEDAVKAIPVHTEEKTTATTEAKETVAETQTPINPENKQ